MTDITFQDGKVVMRDGKVGTGQACCCGGGVCRCNINDNLKELVVPVVQGHALLNVEFSDHWSFETGCKGAVNNVVDVYLNCLADGTGYAAAVFSACYLFYSEDCDFSSFIGQCVRFWYPAPSKITCDSDGLPAALDLSDVPFQQTDPNCSVCVPEFPVVTFNRL